MKKITLLLSLVAILPSASFASTDFALIQQVEQIVLNQAMLGVNPLNMIDWKVGDTNQYTISIGPMANFGSMVQTVEKEEGNGVWLKQDMDLKVQKQVVEILLDRADGSVKKVLINGKEQSIPDQNLEIIETNTTTITVPAGTFQVMYVKAKQDGKIVELWANMVDIAMDGMAKTIADTGMGGMSMTLELQSTMRTP